MLSFIILSTRGSLSEAFTSDASPFTTRFASSEARREPSSRERKARGLEIVDFRFRWRASYVAEQTFKRLTASRV